MDNKINTYRKALHIAHGREHSRAKQDKCLYLTNRLHQLESNYWQDILHPTTKQRDIQIPLIDYALLSLDITIQNPIGDKYNLSINDISTVGLTTGNVDIYGTGFPLCEPIPVDTTETRKSINVLVRVKHPEQDTDGTLPVHVPFASTDYVDHERVRANKLLDTSYKEIRNRHGDVIGYGLKKPKPRKKEWKTVVRRKTRHGRTLPKRYLIEEKDYIYLFHGQRKGYKATGRKLVKRDKNKHYIHLQAFSKVTNYLESITLDFLYDEKIRNHVTCVRCNRRATLLQYENKLGCTQCNMIDYKVTPYRIRLFYVDNYTRYELNELNGIIKKQSETFHGFKTLYHGKISP